MFPEVKTGPEQSHTEQLWDKMPYCNYNSRTTHVLPRLDTTLDQSSTEHLRDTVP
jgi:hypothetical protein